MGKLMPKGFHCPSCNLWGPQAKLYGKARIACWFKVGGKLYRYCQTCTDKSYAELEVALGKEGKTVKTIRIAQPPQVIVCADMSDYTELKLDTLKPGETVEDVAAKAGLTIVKK